MLAIIIEIFGELILQVLIEALIELGFHALAAPFRKPPNPWMAGIGYGVFGVIAGGLSLLAFPHHMVSEPWRIVNVIAVPIAAGLCMCLMGKWRQHRGQEVLRIDRFAYGYLFALSFALVRYLYAK